MPGEQTTRLGLFGLTVVGLAAVVLPLVTPTPMAWSHLPIVAIAAATVLLDWKPRLAVVPMVVLGSSLAMLVRDVEVADVVTAAGIAVISWLLLSSLRAAVQRAIRSAVVERRRAERTRDVLGMMSELVTLDPAQTIERVADAAVTLGYPLVSVAEVVEDHLHDIEARGLPPGRHMPPLPVGHGVLGTAVAQRAPLYVEDYQNSEFALPVAADLNVGAAMAAPIVLDGEVVGGLLAARNDPGPITAEDRRFFEALVAQAARALDVAQRYRAEQQVAQRLAELERLKHEFLESITADLRGPLTLIRGLAFTLSQQGEAMDPDERIHLLDRINESVDRLNRMVESLLDFSRVRKDAEGAARIVPLAEIGQQVVTRAGQSFPQHSVALVTNGRCQVDGDSELLGQAMAHLIDNACRHTPPGTRVTLSVEEAAGIVTVQIVDDGPGLPAVIAEAVRLDAVSDLQGTLGFTLVSHILAAHGTRLEMFETRTGTVIGFVMSVSEIGLTAARAAGSRQVTR